MPRDGVAVTSCGVAGSFGELALLCWYGAAVLRLHLSGELDLAVTATGRSNSSSRRGVPMMGLRNCMWPDAVVQPSAACCSVTSPRNSRCLEDYLARDFCPLGDFGAGRFGEKRGTGSERRLFELIPPQLGQIAVDLSVRSSSNVVSLDPLPIFLLTSSGVTHNISHRTTPRLYTIRARVCLTNLSVRTSLSPRPRGRRAPTPCAPPPDASIPAAIRPRAPRAGAAALTSPRWQDAPRSHWDRVPSAACSGRWSRM